MPLCLLLALSAFLVAGRAVALDIAVVPFPEYGHYGPTSVLVQAAVSRGHKVTVYTADFALIDFPQVHGAQYVNIGTVLEKGALADDVIAQLVDKPAVETFVHIEGWTTMYYERLLPALLKEFNATPAPDVFLIDVGSEIATAVANKLRVPAVLFWPLTLSFPVTLNVALPALASGLSIEMSFWQRVYNYLLQRISFAYLHWKASKLNRLRAEHGVEPMKNFDDMYYRYPIITPSVFGFDLPQQLCPNVFPVGFIMDEMPSPPADTKELYDWMDTTCEHVVYWNLGSVAQTSKTITTRFAAAIENLTLARPSTCHVWKITKFQQEHLAHQALRTNPIIRMVAKFPFSPRYLLKHSKMRVFVTHCGDTSVYEAIEAMVPMVGIGLFADQPDVCARVADAKLGLTLDKLTLSAGDLARAVGEVLDSHAVIAPRLKRLRAVGLSLGGPSRAVDVVEQAADPWFSDMLRCGFADDGLLQRLDIDVLAATGFTIAVIATVIAAAFRCCCASTAAKKHKTD